MADYFTAATAERAVPMSVEEFDELQALLNPLDADGFPVGDEEHGFDMEFDEEGAYLFGESSVEPAELPEPFRKRLGELIAKAGLPHLQVGVAWTCSKLRPDSHGGTAFRIMADGRIEYPQVIWGYETHIAAAELAQEA